MPLLELGANENPFGPSPRVLEAVRAALPDLHRYPDPRGGALKAALSARHAVDPSSIVLGNGSHELLMQLSQAFAGTGDDVVMSQYGFAVYAIAAQAVGARVVAVAALPRDHAMPRGHDLDAIRDAITPATKLVYLANPNNPTGTWFGADAFAAFVSAVRKDVIVVVDEAYAEFADAPDHASALSLQSRHPNVVVTRTFSKAYALAGLRVGYAVADPQIVDVLERLRENFNVGVLSLVAAEAALIDATHLQSCVSRTLAQRVSLAGSLRQRGYPVSPSQANFLLVEFGAATAMIEAALLEAGVVVRPVAGYGLPDCLRITIGTAEDNRRLLSTLDAGSK